MKDTPNIIYEDDYLIGAHKPAWWLTHPSNEARHIKDNMMSFLRDQVGQYVYAINRLDLQSSGVVLFAKYKETVKRVKEAWSSDTTIKKYLALVHGIVDSEGRFDFALNDDNKNPKESLTLYKALNYFDDTTLVEVEIKTGRRHQIRRHFSRRMHALIGDRKYGKKKWNDPFKQDLGLMRMFLHAKFLSFIHPYSLQTIEITSALPLELEQVLSQLIAKNS